MCSINLSRSKTNAQTKTTTKTVDSRTETTNLEGDDTANSCAVEVVALLSRADEEEAKDGEDSMDGGWDRPTLSLKSLSNDTHFIVFLCDFQTPPELISSRSKSFRITIQKDPHAQYPPQTLRRDFFLECENEWKLKR